MKLDKKHTSSKKTVYCNYNKNGEDGVSWIKLSLQDGTDVFIPLRDVIDVKMLNNTRYISGKTFCVFS